MCRSTIISTNLALVHQELQLLELFVQNLSTTVLTSACCAILLLHCGALPRTDIGPGYKHITRQWGNALQTANGHFSRKTARANCGERPACFSATVVITQLIPSYDLNKNKNGTSRCRLSKFSELLLELLSAAMKITSPVLASLAALASSHIIPRQDSINYNAAPPNLSTLANASLFTTWRPKAHVLPTFGQIGQFLGLRDVNID